MYHPPLEQSKLQHTGRRNLAKEPGVEASSKNLEVEGKEGTWLGQRKEVVLSEERNVASLGGFVFQLVL